MNETQTVLEFRVHALEGSVGKIEEAVKSIDSSLQILVKLEAHHAETRGSVDRAFTLIADHEKRMRDLEKEAPVTKLVRGWIIAGVIGVVCLVGVAVIELPIHYVPQVH